MLVLGRVFSEAILNFREVSQKPVSIHFFLHPYLSSILPLQKCLKKNFSSPTWKTKRFRRVSSCQAWRFSLCSSGSFTGCRQWLRVPFYPSAWKAGWAKVGLVVQGNLRDPRCTHTIQHVDVPEMEESSTYVSSIDTAYERDLAI